MKTYFKQIKQLGKAAVLGTAALFYACAPKVTSPTYEKPVVETQFSQLKKKFGEENVKQGNFQTEHQGTNFNYNFLVNVGTYAFGVISLDNREYVNESNKMLENFNATEFKQVNGSLVNRIEAILKGENFNLSTNNLDNHLAVSNELNLFANGLNGNRRPRDIEATKMPGTQEILPYAGDTPQGNLLIYDKNKKVAEVTQPNHFTIKKGILQLPLVNGDIKKFFNVGKLNNGVYEVRIRVGGKEKKIGTLDKDSICPTGSYLDKEGSCAL